MGLLSKLCVQNQKQIYFKVIQYPAASWKLQVLKTLPFVHGKMLSLLPYLCCGMKPVSQVFAGFIPCLLEYIVSQRQWTQIMNKYSSMLIEKDISSLVNSRPYHSQSSHLKFFIVCVYTHTHTHTQKREWEKEEGKSRLFCPLTVSLHLT